jgi:hypothetical protein
MCCLCLAGMGGHLGHCHQLPSCSAEDAPSCLLIVYSGHTSGSPSYPAKSLTSMTCRTNSRSSARLLKFTAVCEASLFFFSYPLHVGHEPVHSVVLLLLVAFSGPPRKSFIDPSPWVLFQARN